MTKANPYSEFLGGRDPVELMREAPRRLRELAGRLGDSGLERSLGPGKWPARSILSHLADCEIVFAFRLRQTLTVDNYPVQPFDQEKWALPYDSMNAQHAIEVFTAVRNWNVAFIKTLTAEDLKRKASHPERGEMTISTILEAIAGHDNNHLQQLEKIAAQ